MRAVQSAYHPAFLAAINIGRAPLSDDPDTAVAQTIRQMAEYVNQDRVSPFFQTLGRRLRGASSDDTIHNVWDWIKARVRFVPDSQIAAMLQLPPSQLRHSSIAEVLIRPADIVRMDDPMGDCDDFSMLGACLLTAAGIPCSFVTLAADAREPSNYSHVYLETMGRAFDSSHGPFVGWEARNRFGKRQSWSVNNGMAIYRRPGFGLHGLGQGDATGDVTFDYGTSSVDPGGPLMLPSVVPGFVGPIAPGTPLTSDNLSLLFSNAASPAPDGTLNTGGGGAIPTGGSTSAVPWWSSILSNTVNNALSIIKTATLPPGTYINTRTGVTSTSPAISSALTASSITGATLTTFPSWIWIGLAAVVLLMLLKKK
jgi:hypothetical protein